jgi:excinuclease UvrABC nuclease subunit
MRLNLVWSGYYEYTRDNVQKYAPTSAGVYKIATEQTDGKLKVCYVGQTENIDQRLKEHLDLNNEQNECLSGTLKKYVVWFSYAEVDSANDRDGAERALYYHYNNNSLCNDSDGIPNGPIIDINPSK